jgi:arylsulfatase A-like enzyme/Tfp pilus assembly protein PilF
MSPEGTAETAKTAEKIVFCVLGVLCGFFFVGIAACSSAGGPGPKPTARNLVLITIDTLRADHVGAYGWSRAQTATLDGLAKNGALFERAYAAAPITLPSHATLFTGRYPPGHGARDNGLRVSQEVPTIATELHARGFATAAFVAAFPLDHQFGLNRGFDVYGDRLPRAADGRPANERPAADVVNDAIAWLRTPGPKGPGLQPKGSGPQGVSSAASPQSPAPFFLWVHLFEPHAPYGDPSSSRPALDRYDEEIATADREAGRLITALGSTAANTLIVAAGDHGEAFGEHGEYAHSIFVYDTTLRVPLLMAGPGIPAGTRVADAVTLADVAPTVMRILGAPMANVDGIDVTPAFAHTPLQEREIYAESFAPLVEFGWAPLRAVRSGGWKLIAAPKPELFDGQADAGERNNAITSQPDVARRLEARVDRYSTDSLSATAAPAGGEAAQRLRALGYSSGATLRDPQSSRPDPKDRREAIARIAQVTSGELSGSALLAALEGIVRDDPRNAQAQLRLGYARLQAGDCARAEPAFHAAAASGLPTADVHLGLATCLGQRGDLAGAERALAEAQRIEPDNPAVIANLGLLQASKGDFAAAIQSLTKALAVDPGLHEARFNLALTYARAGRKTDAAAAARDLLARLPVNAPQRPEVERLLRAVQ